MWKFAMLWITMMVTASSCATVTLTNPGEFTPLVQKENKSKPQPLRVAVQQFRYSENPAVHGAWIDRAVPTVKSATTRETARLTRSFHEDLTQRKIFSSIENNSPEPPDLILEGEINTLIQPAPPPPKQSNGSTTVVVVSDHHHHTTEAYAILAAAIVVPLVIYGLVVMAGVPTDCEPAESSFVVHAKDPEFGQTLKSWSGWSQTSDCAGLWYEGRPLAKSLALSSKQILDQIQKDADNLTKRLTRYRYWYREFGIASSQQLFTASAIPNLAIALRNTDPNIRIRAIRALGTIGPQAATVSNALVGTLTSSDPNLRREGLRALNAIGAWTPAIASILSTIASSDTHIDIQNQATATYRALWFLNHARTRPTDLSPDIRTAIEQLGHTKPDIRITAARHLGANKTQAQTTGPALTAAVADKSDKVRLEAIWALGQLNYFSREVDRRLLTISLKDQNPTVRAAAEKTHRQLVSTTDKKTTTPTNEL